MPKVPAQTLQLIKDLTRLAEQLGVAVATVDLGPAARLAGGLCKVHGRFRLLLDRRASPADQIALLASSIRSMIFEEGSCI